VSIDFKPIADHLGFSSPREMFIELYNIESHDTNSIRKMGKYLGVDRSVIIKQLRKFKIKSRPVGATPGSNKGVYHDKTNLLIERREVLKSLTVEQIVERFSLDNENQFRQLAKRHNLEYKRVGKLYS